MSSSQIPSLQAKETRDQEINDRAIIWWQITTQNPDSFQPRVTSPCDSLSLTRLLSRKRVKGSRKHPRYCLELTQNHSGKHLAGGNSHNPPNHCWVETVLEPAHAVHKICELRKGDEKDKAMPSLCPYKLHVKYVHCRDVLEMEELKQPFNLISPIHYYIRAET